MWRRPKSGRGWRATCAVAAFLLALSTCVSPLAHAQAGGLGTRVNVEFRDAPLPQVFQSLADVSGLNVVIDPGVEGLITLVLRDVTAGEAVDLAARLSGYGYEIAGNTLLVAPRERLRANPGETGLALIPIRQADLHATADLVSRLFPDVEVVPDATTGSLIVRGRRDDLAEIRGFVAQYEEAAARPLQFRAEPVDSALWALAERAGWNLVIEGHLEGQVTAYLEGLDYRHALTLLGAAAGLDYRLDDNVLYVRQLPAPVEATPVPQAAVVRLHHVRGIGSGCSRATRTRTQTTRSTTPTTPPMATNPSTCR
ncbi:MAG: hypothetical protein BAA04_10180 [Firmicutes bacterium ZCTH02-B6]|nr:MAG: hypothetical protein BAA04_10180 [Firmicutes bacterium ZCTH02-B6]